QPATPVRYPPSLQTLFRSNELAGLYKAVMGERRPEDVTVHCGSGVTACHTLLALEQAGLSGARLYVGSWSEWSRNDKPIGRTESDRKSTRLNSSHVKISYA